MLKNLLVALVMGFAVPGGMTAVASFAFVPEAQAWSLKKAAKKAVKKVKKVAKKHGRTAKISVKGFGPLIVSTGKDVGRAAEKSTRVGRYAAIGPFVWGVRR